MSSSLPTLLALLVLLAGPGAVPMLCLQLSVPLMESIRIVNDIQGEVGGREHSAGPGGLSCTEVSVRSVCPSAGVAQTGIDLPELFLSSVSLKVSCVKMNVTDIFADNKVRGKPARGLWEVLGERDGA